MKIRFYKQTELKTLHRSFLRPSVSALYNLLSRANQYLLPAGTKPGLKSISECRKLFMKNSQRPRRLILTVGTEDMRFNHTVQVDTMFLELRPVILPVNLATNFSATRFLKNQTTSEIWKSITRLCSMMYVRPPEFLHVYQESNYTSKEMEKNEASSGITLLEAPI